MGVDHFFGSREVTTRKQHQCLMCYRKFEPGTKMTVGEQIFDGDFSRFYECETCKTLCKEFRDCFYDDMEGFFPGGIVAEFLQEPEYKGMTPEQMLESMRIAKVSGV